MLQPVQSEQQVADQGAEQLDVYGVRASPQKAANAQVLLDPLEEQLDLPARLVVLGDAQCRAAQVIGGECQGAIGLIGASDDETAQRLPIRVASAAAGIGMLEAHDGI